MKKPILDSTDRYVLGYKTDYGRAMDLKLNILRLIKRIRKIIEKT